MGHSRACLACPLARLARTSLTTDSILQGELTGSYVHRTSPFAIRESPSFVQFVVLCSPCHYKRLSRSTLSECWRVRANLNPGRRPWTGTGGGLEGPPHHLAHSLVYRRGFAAGGDPTAPPSPPASASSRCPPPHFRYPSLALVNLHNHCRSLPQQTLPCTGLGCVSAADSCCCPVFTDCQHPSPSRDCLVAVVAPPSPTPVAHCHSLLHAFFSRVSVAPPVHHPGQALDITHRRRTTPRDIPGFVTRA